MDDFIETYNIFDIYTFEDAWLLPSTNGQIPLQLKIPQFICINLSLSFFIEKYSDNYEIAISPKIIQDKIRKSLSYALEMITFFK